MTARRDRINRIVDALIEREGGLKYTNRRHDRGGPTKAGITLRTLAAWRARRGIRPTTAADVEGLGRLEIEDIYRSLYIEEPGYDYIEDDQLFEHVVDSAVHHGEGWSTRALQKIIGVAADGIIGPITQGALDRADPDRVNLLLAVARIKFCVEIVVRDARGRDTMVGQIENIRGWINRLVGFIEAEAND